MADLIPIDPNSDVAKEILTINQQSQTLPPPSQGGGVRQLIPVDPRSQVGQEVLTMATQQAGDQLEKTKPQRGNDLTPKPHEPLFMEKYGLPRPPGSDVMEKVGWPIANVMAGMLPVGRVAKAGIGAGMSALEDISHGNAPSVGGMAVGAGSSLIPEGVVQAGKYGLRQASKLFGKGPLVKGAEAAAGDIVKAPTVAAASSAFEGAKNMTTPLAGAGDEFRTLAGELMKKEGRAGLGKEVSDVIGEEVSAITNARLAGKPLNYGEVFQRARIISDKAMEASSNDSAQLFKLHDALINDISKVSPEAQQAVAGYKLAKTGERVVNAVKAGKPESVAALLAKAGEQFTPQQAKDLTTIAGNLGKVSESNWKNVAAQVGLSAGSGLLTGGAGAATIAPGIIMSALVRMPGGAGVSIAKSLVSPEGEISKLVLPAVGMAVRSFLHEKGLHGND